MATYLVFEPADGKRAQETAERVVFLREKFSPWAFAFTPFWLLRHRLWLGFLIWLVAVALIALVGEWIGFGPYAAPAAMFFPSLLFGMEAVNLRGRKLVREGFREAGVVIADDLETAERKFFDSWKNRPAPANDGATNPATVYPDTKLAAATAEPGVIGLFPTPGAQR